MGVSSLFTSVTNLVLKLFISPSGLSLGLEQSGFAKIMWAIENDPVPASAFAQNFPACVVYRHDCNDVLRWLKEVRTCLSVC